MTFEPHDERELFLYTLGGKDRFLSNAPQLLKSARSKAVLFAIDLTGFTEAWEKLGFLYARTLLDHVAQRLSQLSKMPGDFFWLEGSDEFVLFSLDCKDQSSSLQEISSKFNEDFDVSNNRIRLSAKIGVAEFPKDGRSAHELLQTAHLRTKIEV